MYIFIVPETYSAYLAEIQAESSRVFSLNLERPHFMKIQFLYSGQPSTKECHMIVMLHKECKDFSFSRRMSNCHMKSCYTKIVWISHGIAVMWKITIFIAFKKKKLSCIYFCQKL